MEKWITNCHKTEVDKRYPEGYSIGPPRPTTKCSQEKLEEWGYVGIYDPKEPNYDNGPWVINLGDCQEHYFYQNSPPSVDLFKLL